MEVVSFFIYGSVWIDADILPIYGYISTCVDDYDGERCFQSLCLQMVSSCWEILWWSCQCLLVQLLQRLVTL